ncbi:MAG: 3'-5' exonuclease, partial [Bacillota bacterium]|nr:3'-5' exonuclease [Bacillota bacterium]
IFDSKLNEERPLEYKDMVILLRSTKTRGEVFYKALEDAGIPVYLERGEGYFDTPEIQVLLNILLVVDNFKRDIPLISVLHFPSFGFLADQLAKIRIFANENGLIESSFSDAFKYYEQNAVGQLKEKCTEFLNQIEMYRTLSKAMPLADFIWTILTESGIGNYIRALPSGAQRYANVSALVEKAESFELQNGGGLYSFVSYIELISKGDRAIETGQVTVLKEGSDTVRIMTIHKSKGLEFPFVLLSGLSSTFMSSKSNLHLAFHKDLGASIRVTDPLKGLFADPISLNLINQKKSQEDFAEIIRVLYVALTRAKDILILSAVVKDANAWMQKRPFQSDILSCKNYLDMIGPSFNVTDINVVSLADLTKVVEPNGFAKLVLDSLDKGFSVNEKDLPVSIAKLKERIEYDYSPKEEDLLKHKYSVSEITQLMHQSNQGKKAEKQYGVPLFALDSIPVDAAAKGTAYHTVMQHLEFDHGPKDAKAISDFIDSLKERMLLTNEEANAIDPERISKFFDSDIGKRAAAAKIIYKEKPFVLKTQFEGREVLVQGTIDCFFEEDGKFVLVDYKSNYIDKNNLESEKERLTQSYIPQLKLYKEALEKITGKTVKEAVLYLFGINDIIKVC